MATRKTYPLIAEAVRTTERSAWAVVDAVMAETDLSGERFEWGEVLEVSLYLKREGVDVPADKLRRYARVARFITEADEHQAATLRRSSVWALLPLAQAGYGPAEAVRLADDHGGRITQTLAREVADGLTRGVNAASRPSDPANWGEAEWEDFDHKVRTACERVIEAEGFERDHGYTPSTHTAIAMRLVAVALGRRFQDDPLAGAGIDWDAELAALTDPPA